MIVANPDLRQDEEVTIQLREIRYIDLAATVLVGLSAIVGQARGDAIVVTKAMQASTIAEIFIDQQGVRIELEIAAADLEVFEDLLPDKLYAARRRETACVRSTDRCPRATPDS